MCLPSPVLGEAAQDPATAAAITTNADGPIEVRNTVVVATTTTITTVSGNGAGLIVSFTSTNADPTQLAALTVVDGGDGYTTGDTVEIDGYPGSVVTVTLDITGVPSGIPFFTLNVTKSQL